MNQDSCSKEGMGGGEKGVKLFGVRICGEAAEAEEEVMRKSWSMDNLASCTTVTQPPADNGGAGDSGYLSDGGVLQSSRRRRAHERKRGVPWTEEEHRTFLAGLQKLGKGDWRGISRNFVITRTPTQVASHAQKYFLRQTNPNKKKRRSSLFDVVMDGMGTTTETVPMLSSNKNKETKEAINEVSGDNYLVGDSSSVKDQAVPALSFIPMLSLVNKTAAIFSGNSTVRAPDFLTLFLPHPYFPAQSSATPSSIESSDLELSIAPPQPHSLAKFSSHGTADVIKVI